jgi:hypothetical protein
VVGYQQLTAVQEATAKVVFGQLKPKGHLPVSVNHHFKYGTGLTINPAAVVPSHPVMPSLAKKKKKTVGKGRQKTTYLRKHVKNR